MRKNGLISIITATYNMAEYIGETLDSILAQDYPDIESIVIDDGSTDNTLEVLKPYLQDPRVRLIQQANAGQTVAKNRGISEAQGEFVAFCDADDTWRQDKLSKQIPAFEDNEVAVAFSDINFMDGEGQVFDSKHMKRVGGQITAPLLIDNFIPFPTSIVRAAVLDEVGGFDKNLTMSIDYDLWLRISVDYRFAYIEEPLANYRIWEGQMSKRLGERLENFNQLLQRFFATYPDVVKKKEMKIAWAHFYVTRAYWNSGEGRLGKAVADYSRAMRLHFFDRRLWHHVSATILRRY
jgi:glycosyltransferase involved in cell wall biosynthesis